MVYELFAPQEMRGEIHLPASKSLSGRALIIGALAHARQPENVSDCDDTRAMLAALAHPEGVVDIGAAGTAMRFLTALLAARPGCHATLTGSTRMLQRPIGLLVDALRRLGAHIDYASAPGCPPLLIEGQKLHGGRVELPGDVSSQYVSALLMIGPTLSEGLTLHLTGRVVSLPYIIMTVELMRAFGARVSRPDERTFCVAAGGYKDRPYCIENDWSAASYWYELMALTPDVGACVQLPGLSAHSLQGDAHVAELFAQLGVHTSFTPHGAELCKRPTTVPAVLELDLKNQPDVAQTLVCTCLSLGLPFAFSGLANLKIKETDRLAALTAETAKLGYVLREDANGSIAWTGERCTPREHPVISTYQDHRMAMSFAPMALRLPALQIADPGVVSKSYPHFWDDLRHVGFTITES